MRMTALATGILLMTAMPAFADHHGAHPGEEALASRFGNTTLTTDPFGNAVHLYYAADHTFKVKVTTKGVTEDFKGSWKVEDGKVCLHYDDNRWPKGDPNPTCAPVTARKVGETWKVKSDKYEKTVSIVEGIK